MPLACAYVYDHMEYINPDICIYTDICIYAHMCLKVLCASLKVILY